MADDQSRLPATTDYATLRRDALVCDGCGSRDDARRLFDGSWECGNCERVADTKSNLLSMTWGDYLRQLDDYREEGDLDAAT